MKRFLQIGVLSVLALLLAVGGTALAQQSQQSGGSGFRLSPTRDDLTIERGTTTTTTIFVRNVSSGTQTARAVVDDFSANENESGSPQLLVGDQAVEDYPYSIKPFVLAIDDIVLEPGEEEEVLVTLSIPEETSPGSYFGLLRFVALEEDADINSDTALSLTASVGTILLVTVPGETTDLLSLESIGVVKDGASGSLFSSPPNAVAIRLRNEGNTFQAPFGKILVKNWSGDVVHEYELNNTTPRGNVLPDTVRRFEDELQNIGSFGRYTVEANISYGDGSNLIPATVTFWVVPWLTIGIILVGVIVLAFVGTRGLKAYNKSIVEKSKGTRVKKK